jgi:hypothetical protein
MFQTILLIILLSVLLMMLIFDVAVFPIIATKNCDPEIRGSRAFKFGMFTLSLIIALGAVFFASTYIMSLLPEPIYLFYLTIGAPILNCAIIYFITKKLEFIDSRGKRVAYAILTTVCLIMFFVCCIFTVPFT